MQERDLYEYYAFGYNYRIISIGNEGDPVEYAVRNIDRFVKFVTKYNLKVTIAAMGGDLEEIKTRLLKLDQNGVMPPEESKNIRSFFESIDKTLDAELGFASAYLLTEKRLGLDKLLHNVSDLFSAGSFGKLTDLCKKDFVEAGLCLAFERYTASAFHILRATEEALRQYYNQMAKSKKIKKLLWYDMTEDLKGRKGVPDSLIAVLNSIREDFRNPTAHPEKTYGEDEVQSLFTHCIDVVNRISKQLQ